MTDPRKLVTSLDVSRKVAEVLGYDVKTYLSWVNEPDGWVLLPNWLPKQMTLTVETVAIANSIPAYTVTELASMVTFPVGFHISADPYDMALDVLSQIKRDKYDDEDTTVESCLRNLREWQEVNDEMD